MQTCKKEKAVHASELLSFATNTASPTVGGELGICKEQRDGIAIATVKVNRVTYDPYQTKLIIKNKKKTTLSSCLLYGSPGRICKEQSDGIADLPANRVTTSGLRA